MTPNGPSQVDFSALSQNWKNLQAKLRANAPKASKRPSTSDDIQQAPRKRRRVEHTSRVNPTASVKSDKQSEKQKEDSAPASAPAASLALWAEDNDIPARDLATAYGSSLKSPKLPTSKNAQDDINGGLSTTAEAGRYVAIDCEMVGVGPTPDAESALARVSLINFHGEQLYDSFVRTKEEVTDYRTAVSGITPQLLKSARSFEEVQTDIDRLLEGKILIGHAVRNDLNALLLGHPRRDIRDTSKHAPFRALVGGRNPGLKRLARELLGVDIQGGEHSSIEDARATMLLFRREKDAFEREHSARWRPDRKGKGQPAKGPPVKGQPAKTQPAGDNGPQTNRGEKNKQR